MKYNIDTGLEFSGLSSLTYIIATKRSGHHAFIEWICEHITDYIYLNNVNVNPDIERDKFQRKHIESDLSLHFSESEGEEFGKVEYDNPGVKNLLLSFENKNATGVSRSGRNGTLKSIISRESVSPIAIIFIRDPINCLASIARYNEIHPNFRVSVEEQASKWVSLAKDFYEPSRVSKLLNMPVKTLRYNDFIRNNIEITSLIKDIVKEKSERQASLSRFGGGGDSKFDNSNNILSVEALESRWQMLEQPSVLRDVFDSNAALRELSRRFYRDFEGSEPLAQGVKNFLGKV